MQRQRSETVTLDDILITKELSRRSPRPPNWQAEAQAMQPLARQMARDSESLLQTLVEIALELCQAGTAGVSLLETSDGEEVFRWSELAGRFTHDGLIPRDFSPCGVCVDRGTPQLFSHPERYFTYLHDANTPIVEALLLPLIADDHAIGAIWIMSHDEQRHFDAEDVRVMTSLADFTAAALLLKQQQTRELLAVNAALEAKVEQHRQAEDRARALISNLPGGAAFVVDRDLRYLLAEGEALSAAGFKPEDFIGRTIFEVLPPELTTNYEMLYRKALAGESFEYEHNAHDRYYISRGTPLRSPNGEVYAVLAVSYDISDRKIAEAAIAADLKDTQLLHDLSARLTTEDDIQAIYQEIVATAIALTRADAGTVQILDEATQDLLLLATQGFERDMTDHFYHVNASSNTPCGIALRNGDRTFVDFDVPQSEDPDGSLQMHVDAGYLSAQSTPLIARSGKAIGMVSTHWRKHHRPSDRELRFLDLLARQAADLIEQRQAQAALRESEAHFRALAKASSDIVYRMSADWSVMHNLDGKQFIASTTNPKRTWLNRYIPEDEQPQVWAAIESAIQTKSDFELEHRVFREDGTIGWTFSRAIPLLNPQGEIIEWFGAASDITDRKQAEAALRDSEEKYRTLFNSIDEGFCIFELIEDDEGNVVDWIYLEANPAFEQQTGYINPIGKRISEFQPDLERLWFERFACVARTGQSMRFVQYTEAMGIWYDVYALRVGVAGDNRVSLLFTDITERKHREANLAFLADLMNDFAPLATAEEIMEMAGKRIAEHLNLSRYLFVEIYPEAGECTYLLPSRPVGQLEIGGSYILADYHTEEENRLLCAGHSMVVNDVRDGTRSPEQMVAFEAFNIASIVNTPYLSNGRWVFDLGVTRNKPSVWREDEIELLREISARIWLRIERARAEADLRQSEAKYRSLFNSMDEAYAVVEVLADDNGEWNDFLFLEVNPAFVAQTGMEYPVGRKATELLGTPNPQWAKVYGQVAATGKSIRFEEGEATLGRVFDLYVFRLGGEGSRRVAVLFTDITERKRVEANSVLLAGIADDLTRLVMPDEIINAAGGRLGEALNLNLCLFVDVDEERDEVMVHHAWQLQGLPSLKQRFRIADFLTDEFARSQRNRETFIVRDTITDERTDAEAYARLSVGSILAVPFHHRERWVAYLTVTDSSPRDWRADEIEVVRVVAERVFPRIERARAEVGLRESEAKYRSLFESMNEGLAIGELVRDESGCAVDARYLELNPAYERQTGFDRSSALDLLASEVFPTYYRTWLEIVERVLKNGQPERFEQFVPDNQKWFAFHVTPFGGADGFTVLYDDITERKRQEQEQTFLLRLSDALRPIADSVEVLRTAMDYVADHFEVDSAVYHEFDADSERVVTREGRTNSRISMPSLWRLQDFGFYDDLIAGRTIYYDDTETDPRLQDSRESYRAARIRAGVGVASIKRGRLTAMLGITHSEPRHWIDADLRLLEEVAERTWAAVERARAEESLRESEIQRVREQSAREQERQRAENLAELDRAKTLFFSNVSHEFRTPLTLLLAPLQDALSDSVNPLAPSQRERLELAHRNANRLLKLVNTLLDFSRIEVGRMEAVYEPTDLAMFTTELASVFRSAIERAGLRLRVDCPPLPEPVYVDREMWEKIVLNLLSNAFKFTLEGEIAVRLHRADGECAQRNGRAERVRLQIQDTGTGIAPEELPHLFERFYQVRGAQARTHEGSGIGLALVHELIRLHGGTVDVSSVVGQGTCFTVTIPLGTAHLQGDRLRRVVGDSPSETLRERTTTTRTLASTAIGAASYVEEAERWIPADSAPPQLPDLRGENIVKVPLVKGNLGESLGLQTDATFPSARILLVDDNADMRDYLTRILSEYVQVEAVADGATALAAVQEQAPNLVLSDVMMPGLDGFALLKALRADPQTREIPIILLSARAGEESIVEGLEAGADDYPIKPFSAQELVSRVNAHLQMAQLRGEALRQERTTSRRKDELLSTVSHELNTPLVAILGWTRLLRGSPPSQSMLMKSLETIERNATLQAKLIQDLLDISRITAGKVRLSLQPVELQSVIENAIAAVLTAAIAKDIHLQWQPTDRNPSVTVLGDRDRLQQIICNLLTNAIKFTPESGSITVQLVVKESWESKVAEIGITDTGIGIATDFLPHVFDRFRQAEGANSAKGLGLGLAIARHLVELHNGTIHAESSGAGLGATFTVKLPILQE